MAGGQGIKCTVFTDAEQMQIAQKYVELVVVGGGTFSRIKSFVQNSLDGGSRARSRDMVRETVKYWAKVKIPKGQAPGDDRRRYNSVYSHVFFIPLYGQHLVPTPSHFISLTCMTFHRAGPSPKIEET